MIKYLKLKPRKIKNAKKKIIIKHPHLLSLQYAKQIGIKLKYECWLIKDKEEKINRFLSERLSKPRFQTKDNMKIDTWTGKKYKNLTDMKKGKQINQEIKEEDIVLQEEIDNPGIVEVISETTARTYLKSGETLKKYLPAKTEKEILLEKIQNKDTIDVDVRRLLELMVEEK